MAGPTPWRDSVTPGGLPSSRRAGESLGQNRLGLFLDALQVRAAAEAFRIKLVHVFRAGRACREPALRGDDLQPTDGRTVTRRSGEHGQDRVAGKLGRGDV